ncbi:MAG: AAA family ATPase [Rhodocyclaceae bacterium]|nr:AAA family ATPase [Rhodocyclaceae bacterium]
MAIAPKPYLKSVAFRDDVDVDFGAFPYSVPAVREMGVLEFHPDVTFLVGENGSGKSTLLEAIALLCGFGPEGGTRSVQFQSAETTSELFRHLRPTRSFRMPDDGYFLRAESFYNVASYMDEVGYLKGYGGKSLHSRSHGEAFITLLTTKFAGRGLYLLDEPEAALSPNRQLAALSAIHGLVQNESQFIIATHSPILLAYPNAKIMMLDDDGIREVAYEDTEHYLVTRDFLNNYPRRLEYLFGDDLPV